MGRVLAALGVAGVLAAAPASAQVTPDLAKQLDAQLAGVAEVPAARDPLERARRLEQLADLEVQAQLLTAAKSAYEEAAALRAPLPAQDADLGRLSLKQARLARLAGRPADAAALVEAAAARYRVAAPQSPEFVDVLIEAAGAAAGRGDGAQAEAYYREALEVVVKAEPGGAREARLSELMGDAAVRRNDHEAADQLYSRSLAALEGPARESLDYARVANALAVVAASRNQPDRAMDLYEASVKIYDVREPDGLPLAQALMNLGILHLSRADHAAAEAAFRRSLAIRTAGKAGSEDLGTTHASLGLALLEQGRPAEAAEQFTAAVTLRRPQAPPLELAALLVNLARAERLRAGHQAAAAAAREALEIRREHLPQSLGLAAAAYELGRALDEVGAYQEALPLHREALAIREKLATNSAEMAASLERVAIALARAGDPLEARNTFERTIDAWSRMAAGSLDHVDVIHELGVFLLASGHPDEGLRRLREAVDLLERARPALPAGTVEAQAELPARLAAYYGAPMRAHADRGDAGEAFSLLDRLREQQRRARCAACRDGALPASPFAALKQVLMPGTLLVAFSVQPDATYAWVGAAAVPLRVYRINVKAEALEERVRRFAARVRNPSAAETPLVAEGRALFRLLFGQFEDAADQAERLLLVPDAALDVLPFGALARVRTGRDIWHYVADWKPLWYAPSVMAAAAWAGGAPAPASPEAVVDPARGAGPAPAVLPLALPSGAVVALWPGPEQTAADFLELFKSSLAPARARETALQRAQRAWRDRRAQSHPAYWAGYRYYGSRGIK
jgi:tetratricopeptide (TPR) repeat protein